MLFNLDDQDNSSPYSAERTREELREDKQKAFNSRQKAIAKLIGDNLASYVCILVAIIVVGLVWTDIGLPRFSFHLVLDAILTTALFIIAETTVAAVGVKGGKLDDAYITHHREYLDIRKAVITMGITLMDVFCEWQIDVEFERYVRRRCKKIKLDYNEYKAIYADMSDEDIKQRLPLHRAAAIIAINKIEHIDLTPDILLTDGRAKNERGNVPISGEEYVDKNTVGAKYLILTFVFAILCVFPAFSPSQESLFGRILFTILRLAVLMYRIYKGYSKGAKAFNDVEIKHLDAKTRYLYIYREFLDKKIYKNFGDKYGPILTDDESEAEGGYYDSQ
jgi:hypothetical protein